jgi:hypothetical protein
MSVSEIIGSLGGSAEIARYTSWPVTTVDSWKDAGHIPEWRQAALLRMALDKGISLSTSDFPAKRAKAA